MSAKTFLDIRCTQCGRIGREHIWRCAECGEPLPKTPDGYPSFAEHEGWIAELACPVDPRTVN